MRAYREAVAPSLVRERTGLRMWLDRLVRWLPRDHVLAVLDQGVVSAGTFLATLMIGHWTSPSELGEYAIGMTVLFSAAGAQDALITTPYVIRRNRADVDRAALVGGALLQSLSLGAITACALLLAAVVAFPLGQHAFAQLAATLAFVAPCLFLRDFARQLSFAHGQVARALAMDCMATTLQVGGIALLGATGKLGPQAAYLANAVAFGLAATVWLLSNRVRIRLHQRDFWRRVADNWALGRWLGAAQFTVSVQVFVASWLLVLIDGTHAAGVYAACMTLVSLVNPVIMGSGNVLLPRTARTLRLEGFLEMRRRVVRDALGLGGFLACVCLFLAFGSDFAMGVLFHRPEYQGHHETILLLGFALLATAIAIPGSNGLNCIERPDVIFWAALGSAAVNATLGLMLIPAWGIVGAAFGFFTGNMVGTSVRWLMLAAQPEWRSPGFAEQARRVLQRFDQRQTAGSWAIRPIAEGEQAVIVAASSPPCAGSGEGRDVLVRLFKPKSSRAAAAERLEALGSLHATLDGSLFAGWRIAVPEPIRLCEAPLALITTRTRGRTLSDHLASVERSCFDMESVAQAIASALKRLWSSGQTCRDLSLDSILCDPGSRTLSFVDPGTPSRVPSQAWASPSPDLGYLLFESARPMRRSLFRRRGQAQLLVLAAAVIRAVLADMPGASDRRRLIDEIQAYAQQLFGPVEPARMPRAVRRAMIRRIGLRRVRYVMNMLRSEIGEAATAN